MSINTNVTRNDSIVIDVQQETSQRQGFVSLPLTENGFKEFITGLLGKPQELQKSFFGSFEIELNQLLNLYYLLDQRMSQQNHSRLIQFSAKINFSDSSSVTLNSLEELRTYQEIRPLISTAIKLNWIYLINFADREQLEKQEIELNIRTDSETKKELSLDALFLPIRLKHKSGYIELTIRHTARTWANDIESLLSNQIKQLIDEKNKMLRMIKNRSTLIAFVTSFLFLLSVGYMIYKKSENFRDAILMEMKNNLINSTSIDAKISYIGEFLAKNEFSQIETLNAIGGFAAFFITTLIFSLVRTLLSEILPQNSFVLLTEKSVQFKNKVQKGSIKLLISYFGTVVFAIVTGVMGNYVFDYLTKK